MYLNFFILFFFRKKSFISFCATHYILAKISLIRLLKVKRKNSLKISFILLLMELGKTCKNLIIKENTELRKQRKRRQGRIIKITNLNKKV